MIQPQDLADLKKGNRVLDEAEPRDMKLVLENALKRGYPVVISEREINKWLARSLKCRQGGILGELVSLDGVWVRLEKDLSEVVMERTFMGQSFTTSMFIQIEIVSGENGIGKRIHRHGGPYHALLNSPLRGGRFGKLTVPQGFLVLLTPSYAKLAEVFRQEVDLAFTEMNQVTISSGRIMLDSGDDSLDLKIQEESQ